MKPQRAQKNAENELLDGLKARKNAGETPALPGAEPPEGGTPYGETPGCLEYTPPGRMEKWRVEKFELFAGEFQMGTELGRPGKLGTERTPSLPGLEREMGLFHMAAEGYARGWLIARRLFGIGPVILPADARPEDYESQTREQICGAMGLAKEQLQAELDAVRALWERGLSEDPPSLGASARQAEAEDEIKRAEKGEITFGHEILAEFGFSEKMFEVVTWDPVEKKELPRAADENRAERNWFAGRVGEWRRMLEEPMASALVQEALMNELYLKRLRTEMGRVSPTMAKFTELRSMRSAIETSYQKQLKELGEMFPEMNIAGKVSFQATVADILKAYREYKSRGDTALVDRIRTAGEIEVELRQSQQAPEPRYRFGLNMAIVEAMHGLYDENFRSQFRPATLKKLDAGFRRAVEETREKEGEALVDLEKGVMPGEGDEYAEIPE